MLAWTPDYDDGDVAYIAGTPHPPGPPPPSATSASTLSVETIREGQSHPNPSPALTSSSASEMNGHWTSALSLAHATVGEGSIPEVSILEENAPSTLQEERPPECVISVMGLSESLIIQYIHVVMSKLYYPLLQWIIHFARSKGTPTLW